MHAAEPQPYTKDRPFPATISENRLLSRPGSGKEVRHIVINLRGSGLKYTTGDSIGVYPSNNPAAVATVLARLGLSGDETVQLPKDPGPITLREALTRRVALAQLTPKLLQDVAARAQDAGEAAALQARLAPEAKETTAAWLADREFTDLLAEFPSVRFEPQALCDALRKLNPRLYSIASSPVVHAEEVHTTIAIVRYETNGHAREGVCSTFLADRAGTAAFPVFIASSHFRMPEDPARDVILVGPGTGIAPFRAFLQERIALGAPGRNWLFFGDQKRAYDYLYEEEFEAWHASGKLHRLDLAWSRDQAQKVYVQDRMRANAAELWSWLQAGAAFYVCGDAKRMAKDVDLALHEIIAQQGGLDAAAAAEYVKQLKKDKRYQRDVY